MTHPRNLVVAMFGASAALGVIEAFVQARHEDVRIVTLLSTFTFAPLLFIWCKADATHRRISPPSAAPLLVALFALVGVPYYFLKALPVKQAARSIAVAAGLFLLMWATTVVMYLVGTRVFAS